MIQFAADIVAVAWPDSLSGWLNAAGSVLAAGLFVWLFWRWLQTSEDAPAKLVLKWILTVILVAVIVRIGQRINDQISAIVAVLTSAVCGLGLAALWVPNLCAWISRNLEGLFTGDDVENRPAPLYSAAEAKRKRGRYREAIAAIRIQLDRFPNDFTGRMMLAEVYAVNLNDLGAAQEAVDDLCDVVDIPPKQRAHALNRLADWHLNLGADIEAARRALARIQSEFPDSEASWQAAQRLAHMPTESTLQDRKNPHRVAVVEHRENLGLLGKPLEPPPPKCTPTERAAQLVEHLEQHPDDIEGREELAQIYAEHFHHVELAADQLEYLIAAPNHPRKQSVHWLNRLADLHVKYGSDPKAAQPVLERIIAMNPDGADAEKARTRIARLLLELKGDTRARTVKMKLPGDGALD